MLNGTASCEMVLTLSDPNFLPLSLTTRPLNCSGNQKATFTVPESAGNGIASIQWYVDRSCCERTTDMSRRCDGERSSSCDLVEIQGGCSDLELYAEDRMAANLSLTCASIAQRGKYFHRESE